jgi:glycosyltransferase involved in cell wall biosynthesis
VARLPLVSIVIPCWNAERYVARAIESALAQTYPSVEVIAVDDGSSDGSAAVIAAFGARIRFEAGPNRGAAAARNRGLEMARGELIQFLDADDLLYPSKLERMVPLATRNGAGGTPVCDWERVTEGDSRRPELQRLHYSGEDPVLFCLRGQLQTASPLHWKSDLDAIGGFDESLPCAQERDLHLRLASRGLRLFYLPEVLYLVTRRPNSLSEDYGRVLRQHGEIFGRVLCDLRARGALSEARSRAFAEALARDGRHCLRRGDGVTAKSYFGMAEAIDRVGALNAFPRRGPRMAARLLGLAAAEHLSQLASRLGVRR